MIMSAKGHFQPTGLGLCLSVNITRDQMKPVDYCSLIGEPLVRIVVIALVINIS